jgi:hypothetical protein
MTPTGLELARQYSSLDDSTARAAEINALAPDSEPTDPGLAEVVAAWPYLLLAVRSDIVAKVRLPQDNPAREAADGP